MNTISRKVLCVDDDVNLLRGLKRQLRGRFDVTTSESPIQALQLVREAGPFAVVVSDFQMPGMSGIELLRQVHAISPETILVMLTFEADLNVVIEALHQGHIFRFLNKPCPRELLEQTLNDCLEQHRLIMAERVLTQELNRKNDELHRLNAELEDRVLQRTARIREMQQFVTDLNGLDSLEAVASVVVQAAARMLDSQRVSLMLPDPGGEYLTIVASTGIPHEVASRVRVPVGAPIAGIVFSEARSIIVNQAEPPAAGRYADEVFASLPLACASLASRSRAVGVLNVTNRRGGFFDEEAIEQLKAIAEAASIALLNQIRLQERNEARDATILALARLAEHRDPETGRHLERVQSYCRLLSEQLADTGRYPGVDRQFIDHIVRSSPLHDIGKVGIPDSILLKPDRLTEEEFEIMKTHTTIGGDTLRSLVNKGRQGTFLQMGMQIAYAHHERFDGLGYPLGLAGDQIPLPARILALADVYDALTSRRVYKAAMAHEEATEIIHAERGTHFDPIVVEAFLQRHEDFRQMALALSDAELLAGALPVG